MCVYSTELAIIFLIKIGTDVGLTGSGSIILLLLTMHPKKSNHVINTFQVGLFAHQEHKPIQNKTLLVFKNHEINSVYCILKEKFRAH